MNYITSNETVVKILRSGKVVTPANCSPNSAKTQSRQKSSDSRSKRGSNGASTQEKDRLSNCLWYMDETYRIENLLWLTINLEPIDKTTGEVSKEALVLLAEGIDSVKKKLRYILKKHKIYVYNFGLRDKTTKNQGVPAFDVNICIAFDSDKITLHEQKQIMQAIGHDFLFSVQKLIKHIAKFDLESKCHVQKPYTMDGSLEAFVNYFSACQQESSVINSLRKNGTLHLLPGSYSGFSNNLKPYSESEEIKLPISVSKLIREIGQTFGNAVSIVENPRYVLFIPNMSDKASRDQLKDYIKSLQKNP